QTRARRLVHLSVDQRDVLEDSRFLELEIEIVSFERALTHAAEYGLAAVAFGHVVDQLLNDDGLADARAAEQADLSAFHERREQIDDLDAGLENLRLRFERHEVGALAMNRPP